MRAILRLLRLALKVAVSVILIAISVLAVLALDGDDPSICYGSANEGRLENSRRLPLSGDNFGAYWSVGWVLGRTNMHGAAHDVIAETYRRLALEQPDWAFVYGEAGWPWGGRFWPHRTHRNGLSVDFVVPVRDMDNRSVPFPRSMLTGGFYAADMDGNGQFAGGRIDFEAMASHLAALHLVGQARGVPIRRVIFDPALQPMLFATQKGRILMSRIRFSENRSWFRHDAHYHVDFDVPCRPFDR